MADSRVRGEQEMRSSTTAQSRPALPGREAGLGLARTAMAGYRVTDSSWHYEHGLLLQAAVAAGEAWDDRGLADAARAVSSSLVGEDGAIRGYRAEEYNLDMINSGRNLLELYARTGEGRYKAAVDLLASQLRAQPRTPSGGFWHKLIYPNQMWLDGLFMAQPFAARYAAAFGDERMLEDSIAQFELVAEKTRDPRTGLFRHAWDEKRAQLWADPETGRSPHPWGRAMGWFAMALVDVIEVLSPESSGRARLSGLLAGLAEAAAKYQDAESGLWYQVLDQGGRMGNYLEASVSSMFPYAFLKGARLGALDASRFVPVAKRAYEGAVARFLRPDGSGGLHLEGICAVAGLGGSPYRDGSYEYYVGERVAADDYKGVGPFILASIEYDRAAGGAGAGATR
jgi:unsaturated rhamnogalacturonyl hydrolase